MKDEPYAVALVADVLSKTLGKTPDDVRLVAAWDNFVYEAGFPSGDVILKAGWEGNLGLEAWGLGRAASLGVPVPQVLAEDYSKSLLPQAFFIMTKIDGVALEQAEISVQAQPRLYEEIGELLRQVHSATLDGYGWLSREAFAKGEVRGARDEWKSEIAATINWGLEYLIPQALIPPDLVRATEELRDSSLLDWFGRSCLLHGDFDFRHVFVDPATESITALIDFGDVKCGDPDWEFGVMFTHESRGYSEVLRGYDPTGAAQDRLRTKLPAYGMARATSTIRWLHEHGQPIDYWVGVLEGWSRKLAPVA